MLGLSTEFVTPQRRLLPYCLHKTSLLDGAVGHRTTALSPRLFGTSWAQEPSQHPIEPGWMDFQEAHDASDRRRFSRARARSSVVPIFLL